MADRNRRNKFIFTVGSSILKAMERVVDIIEEEDDDENEDEEVVQSEPLVRKTRTQILRERILAQDRLMIHYFNEDCLYNDRSFRRRFRMHKPLFLRIVNDITSVSTFIRQGVDARQIEGFTSIQKCAVAIRQLAYGSVSDSWDEYFQMSERVVRESLEEFCECIIFIYKKMYLRLPTESDIKMLHAHHAEVHGFPGMIGSLDCMHWESKSCPVAYVGRYKRGGEKHPSIVLEAVASQDLWVWHAFFGAPGSLNDINVLGRSPIFNKICNGFAASSSFTLRDRVYEHGYYLVDDIYPELAVFAKPLKFPGDAKRDRYARFQVRARKDIERTFGVLKSRWKIFDSARPKEKKKVENIVYVCIILHNMILEDEGKALCMYVESENNCEPLYEPASTPYNNIRATLRDNDVHHYLRNDLAEHIWTFTTVVPNILVDVTAPPDATFSY